MNKICGFTFVVLATLLGSYGAAYAQSNSNKACPADFYEVDTADGISCFKAFSKDKCAPGVTRVIVPGSGYACTLNTSCPDGSKRKAMGVGEAVPCQPGYAYTITNVGGDIKFGCKFEGSSPDAVVAPADGSVGSPI